MLKGCVVGTKKRVLTLRKVRAQLVLGRGGLSSPGADLPRGEHSCLQMLARDAGWVLVTCGHECGAQ